VLFLGVRHVQGGTLTTGNLLVVMAYLGMLYRPLETLSKKVASLQSSLASAARAYSLFDQAPEVSEPTAPRPLARARGEIVFEGVSFSYRDGACVLADVSFHLHPGMSAGISGTTGAGKSTLVSLLLRFFDPASGRILLDSFDLRDYRLADLRNQIAVVLQEPVLFATTIAENIAYARPDATEGQIVQAARAAHADDFISALPDGYRTNVGERGMCLSGGERQRISLARAFLKNAPILILDEPTSSVDVESERLIMDAMHVLMRDRTTIMIAHRLSTLERCSIRLHLEHGRLLPVAPAAARSAPLLT
jgi:ATP-binding cassette, subfamily B, bacterial